MSVMVQKFGGTSMANLQCIAQVASKVIQTVNEKHQVVVVVSAMAGETDRLTKLVAGTQQQQADHTDQTNREYANIVATGEQVSAGLLALTLQNQGYKAKSFSGTQIKIRTTNTHRNAKITHIDTAKIRQELAEGTIVVVAGFQGVNEKNEVTTLGRGGSDTTAVAIAAALNASECQIYTDVPGVFTADPSIVKDATLIHEVSFDEMMELASLGAKVLQHRAVEFAGKYKVPLRVLSTFEEGEGTLVNPRLQNMEQVVISGITSSRSDVKFTLKSLPASPDITYRVLEPLAEANICIDMLMHNGRDSKGVCRELSFTVAGESRQQAEQLLEAQREQLGIAELYCTDNIAKLSLVGIGLREHSGVASRMIKSLAQEGIDIEDIVSSEIKISITVPDIHLEQSLNLLHTAFGLEKQGILQ